jgi:hypothetical protein
MSKSRGPGLDGRKFASNCIFSLCLCGAFLSRFQLPCDVGNSGSGLKSRKLQCRGVAHLPWACEAPFQTVHSVSHFLSLSNNLGNLLFARRTTPTALFR